VIGLPSQFSPVSASACALLPLHRAPNRPFFNRTAARFHHCPPWFITGKTVLRSQKVMSLPRESPVGWWHALRCDRWWWRTTVPGNSPPGWGTALTDLWMWSRLATLV
jgi:hypothetical protein